MALPDHLADEVTLNEHGYYETKEETRARFLATLKLQEARRLIEEAMIATNLHGFRGKINAAINATKQAAQEVK